jgi:hypothetical protein
MRASNIGWVVPATARTRFHGELLKLGIEVSHATVSKYMLQSNKPPSQAWRTFLDNHADWFRSSEVSPVGSVSANLTYSTPV